MSKPIHKLQIGQVLRDSRPKSSMPTIGNEGFVNIYAATASPGANFIPLDAGINPIGEVSTPSGKRRPAILIASSPHKSGSVITPWQDLFAPDEGFVRYFGDAKTPGEPAHSAKGNALLVEQFENHHGHPNQDQRSRSVPLIFFERQPYAGTQKGFPVFQGFGVMTAVRIVTQTSKGIGGAFSNFEFEFAVLTMANEGELFDWDWISARRDPSLTDAQTLVNAPAAWRSWVNHGEPALPRLRRRVLTRKTTPVSEQLPDAGADTKLLRKLYDHYDGRKAYFESLAAAIAERFLSPAGASYESLGVTRGSGDGGIDFIARLDIGHGFSRAPIVVLGQAKCVEPGAKTSAKDLARTVARLRRGWVGVFVTTGVISVRAQEEVIEDRYPLVMIPARQVVATVKELLHEQGHGSLRRLLAHYDELHDKTARVSDPEQLVR